MARKIVLVIVFVLALLLATLTASPARPASPPPGEPVRPALALRPPVIDGVLDDPAWSDAVELAGFVTAKPDFGRPASEATTAWLAYDAHSLYFGFRCADSEPSKIKATVGKRDGVPSDDCVAVILDMAGDGQSGYVFFCNPLGIQMDGTLAPDGATDLSLDLVWESRGRVTAAGYELEMAVPLRSLRYPARPEITVGVMACRFLVRKSEEDYCPEFRHERGGFLAQTRKVALAGLAFARPVELLPAFTVRQSRSRGAGAWGARDRSSDLGLTAKLGLTSDLTLDAAVNPDFSQVEADAGQIDVNLRYALYYPEKRPFFLEGMEHFAFAGGLEQNPLAAVVHTRTIADPVLGLKLAGKLGPRDQIASIFSLDRYPGAAAEAAGAPGDRRDAACGIFRYKRLMDRDQYLGAFATAREGAGTGNEVAGFDGRVRLAPDMTLEGFAFGSRTREGGRTKAGEALGLKYSYLSRRATVNLGAFDIGTDFRADAGYLTRTGVRRLAGLLSWKFYPKSRTVGRIDPYYWFSQTYDVPSGLFESQNYFALRALLSRQSMVRVMAIAANEVYAGKRFRRDGWWVSAESQPFKWLGVEASAMDTGAIWYDPAAPFQGRSTRAGAGVTLQPTDRFTTGFDLSYYDFRRDSDGARLQEYAILRSRTVFQPDRRLFFRAIFEYNTWRKRLTADLLASFTYVPGTVLYVGYGAAYDRLRWTPEAASYLPDDRFLPMKRDFFFKASYLWRF